MDKIKAISKVGSANFPMDQVFQNKTNPSSFPNSYYENSVTWASAPELNV